MATVFAPVSRDRRRRSSAARPRSRTSATSGERWPRCGACCRATAGRSSRSARRSPTASIPLQARVLRREARGPRLHRVAADGAAPRRIERPRDEVQLPAHNTPQFAGAGRSCRGSRSRCRRSSSRRSRPRRSTMRPRTGGASSSSAGRRSRPSSARSSRRACSTATWRGAGYDAQQTEEPAGRRAGGESLRAGARRLRRPRSVRRATRRSAAWLFGASSASAAGSVAVRARSRQSASVRGPLQWATSRQMATWSGLSQYPGSGTMTVGGRAEPRLAVRRPLRRERARRRRPDQPARRLLFRSFGQDEAIRDAKDQTRASAKWAVEPVLTEGVMHGDRAELRRLDGVVRERVLRESSVVRVKIWDRTGRIIYSDEARLIGARYRISPGGTRGVRARPDRRRGEQPRRAGEPVRASVRGAARGVRGAHFAERPTHFATRSTTGRASSMPAGVESSRSSASSASGH